MRHGRNELRAGMTVGCRSRPQAFDGLGPGSGGVIDAVADALRQASRSMRFACLGGSACAYYRALITSHRLAIATLG
jgi:hypothetical protein